MRASPGCFCPEFELLTFQGSVMSNRTNSCIAKLTAPRASKTSGLPFICPFGQSAISSLASSKANAIPLACSASVMVYLKNLWRAGPSLLRVSLPSALLRHRLFRGHFTPDLRIRICGGALKGHRFLLIPQNQKKVKTILGIY